MADRVTAEPDRLETYTDETLAAIPRARAAVDDHREAVQRYLAAPSDLPVSADPGRARDALATLDDLTAFDLRPARLARDLRAVDGGSDVRGLIESGWSLYDHPTAAYSASTSLVNVTRYVSTTSRLRRLEAYRALRAPDLRWTGMNRAARRAEVRALHRLARRQLPTARVQQGAAAAAMRARAGFGWTSTIQTRIAARVPAAGRALPLLGRGLGVVSVGKDAWDAAGAWNQGDHTTAAFKAAGAAGGIALLVATGPIGLTAGAVLVGASLAYEYRDEVAAGARWAGRKLSDGLSTVTGWFGG